MGTATTTATTTTTTSTTTTTTTVTTTWATSTTTSSETSEPTMEPTIPPNRASTTGPCTSNPCQDPNASCQVTVDVDVFPSDDDIFEWALYDNSDTNGTLVFVGDFYKCFCNDGFVANGATCEPNAEPTDVLTTTEAITTTETT